MRPPTGFLLWLGSSKVVTLTPPLHQKIYCMYSPTTSSMPQQFLGFEGKSPLRSLWYLHPGHIWGCGSCRFWQVQSMVSSTQHFIHYTYAAPYAVHWAKVMTRLVSICLCVCVWVSARTHGLFGAFATDLIKDHVIAIRLSWFLFSTFEQYDFNCCFATTRKGKNHASNATSISASRVSPTYQWSGCPWVLAVVLFSSLEKHLGVE